MVRGCRPPAREPVRSWLGRRSTMATSTPANANSPANISPVGPPPAITTACSVIATLRPASCRPPPAHHIPRPPQQPCRTAPRVPPSVRRPRKTHTSTTTHAFRYSHFRRIWLRPALCSTTGGLRQAPGCPIYWKWKGVGTLPFTFLSACCVRCSPGYVEELFGKAERAPQRGLLMSPKVLEGVSTGHVLPPKMRSRDTSTIFQTVSELDFSHLRRAGWVA